MSAFLLLGDNIMATQDFNTVLARYQQNLTDYKVTGNAGLVTAVTIDKTWLDSYVASLEQKSTQQQGFIQKFMVDYQTANPDLIEMQGKLKEIRTKGPVLQDAYETEQQAKEEEPMDYTPYYIKAGLIVGVAVVVGVVGALRPVYRR
jgi:flagellar biosynthesis chaperone FliJ